MLSYESTVVVLPNPQFNESLNTNVKTQFEHDMSGGIYSFKKTPATKTFDLPIKFVSNGKVQEVVNFLKLTDGKKVIYKDYDDVSHEVYILDSFNAVQEGRGIDGILMYNFNITLEKV
jgi:hypothetical protein